jgi:hypothetical protein
MAHAENNFMDAAAAKADLFFREKNGVSFTAT